MSAPACAVAPRPLFHAFRRLRDLGCETAEDYEAVCAATAAIADAAERATAETIEDLAAQILIVTREGDFGLPPALLRRLQVLVDTA